MVNKLGGHCPSSNSVLCGGALFCVDLFHGTSCFGCKGFCFFLLTLCSVHNSFSAMAVSKENLVAAQSRPSQN